MATLPVSIEGEQLLRHIERYLGEPARVWRDGADGLPLPVQVLRFDQSPFPDAMCLVTFGLSRHSLATPSGATARTEFVICIQDRLDARSIVAKKRSICSSLMSADKWLEVHAPSSCRHA